jgi:hypothetical protein
MNKTRTIESFVCIVVLVAVLFVGVWQIKPVYATTDVFGQQTQGTDNLSVGDCVAGGLFTCTYGGTALTISGRFYTFESVVNVKCALYSSAGSLVGYTEEKEINTSDWDLINFSFVGAPVILEAVDYYIVAWSDQSDCRLNLYYTGSTNIEHFHINYAGSFPSVFTHTPAEDKDGEEPCIYCTYELSNPLAEGYGIIVANATMGNNQWNCTMHSDSIQTAVSWAHSNGGGNVTLPEGVWNLSISASWTTINGYTNVDIFGAPTERDENDQVVEWKTILQMPVEVPAPENTYPTFFLYEGTQNVTENPRVSDLLLRGYRYFDQSSVTMYMGIEFDDVVNFRVDHCKLEDICGMGIYASIGTYGSFGSDPAKQSTNGVIDHCNLTNHLVTGWPVFQNGYGVDGWSNRSLTYGVGCDRGVNNLQWDTDVSNIFGNYTNYSLFIEDCFFRCWRHAVASNRGVHYVYRFNINDYDFGIGTLDQHGQNDGTKTCGRALEAYNNTITNSIADQWGVKVRGGAALIYNNTFGGGNYARFVGLFEEATLPQFYVHDVYIWDNTMLGSETVAWNDAPASIILDTDYFLRAPNQTLDGFTYTPYMYPHPMVSGEGYVTVTITYPTNNSYTTPTVPVQLSASGGTIDTIWWNCKNGTTWIYGSNQTYTVPTSMTGFVDGASYTFYGWANNTDGEWDEETVMFTVLILYPDWGSWWGDWW